MSEIFDKPVRLLPIFILGNIGIFIFTLLFTNPLIGIVSALIFAVIMIMVIDENFSSLHKIVINNQQLMEYSPNKQRSSFESKENLTVEPHNPFQSEKTINKKASNTQSKVYQENLAGIQSLFAIIIIFIIIVLLVFQFGLI